PIGPGGAGGGASGPSGGGGVAPGGACGCALVAAVLFQLWRERRANTRPVWPAYLPEVPPA
ncbi:MAG: hypothetical protein ACRDPF_39695, partial [Streptosporangiaceae bacterium]